MTNDHILGMINDTAELLYQENESEGYAHLSELIKRLAGVSTAITDIETQNDFILALKMALDAMEGKDSALVADVLLYEIKPRLEALR